MCKHNNQVSQGHTIIHIHDSVMWDWQYSIKYSFIFPTFSQNVSNWLIKKYCCFQVSETKLWSCIVHEQSIQRSLLLSKQSHRPSQLHKISTQIYLYGKWKCYMPHKYWPKPVAKFITQNQIRIWSMWSVQHVVGTTVSNPNWCV